MKTSKAKQIAKYVGFGAVLVTALAISWWSMATMAMNNFGLPNWLAYSVSTAYDGAAIFVAIISTEYAKTDDSGLVARISTGIFIGLSAWLNLQHAQMMGLGLAGQVFYAAPAIIAGLLFEIMLRFENRKELRIRGRVAQSLPAYGRAAWMRFPKKVFKSMSKVIEHRVDKLTDEQTGSQTVSVDKTDVIPVVSEPQTTKKTSKTKSKTELPEWMPSDPTMSVNRLSKVCYDNGVKDIDAVLKLANKVKNVEVSRASVQKGLNRAKQAAANVGGYL